MRRQMKKLLETMMEDDSDVDVEIYPDMHVMGYSVTPIDYLESKDYPPMLDNLSSVQGI